MAVTYCQPAAASSETGLVSMIRKSGNRFSEKIMLHQHARAPNQSFGASFRLDISLANDAAILILLLAKVGRERRSRFADPLEAL